MQLLTVRVLVVLAVLTLTVSVGGQETGSPVVLSKPFDQSINLNVSSEADAQQIADNFQLKADETIDEISWFGGYASENDATVDRSFKLRIFDDNGGGPPKSPIYEDEVSVDGVDTGTVNQDGNRIFQYTAVIDPVVALNAETLYWFSVLENDPGTKIGTWFWQASNPVEKEKIEFRSNDEDAWTTFSNSSRNEMAFSLGATGSITDPSTNLDHFLSYKVKRTKDTPKFEKLVVTLTDQFESGTFEVKKPKELYIPANKNGEGIFDPDTHLVGYQLKRTKGEPKHEKITGILVENQFGTIFVDTKKPDRLLVPSLKDLDIPIHDIEVPAGFTIDHFKCYKVKVSEGSEFPEGIQVDVVDQFETRKLFDIKKPSRLCNPVEERVGGEITEIKNFDYHLMCYKVKRAEDEPKHEKVKGIHINNQFGPLQLDTKKETELCVPSTKTLP